MLPRVRALILQPIHYNTQFFNAIADSGLVALDVYYLLQRASGANQCFERYPEEHFRSHNLNLEQWRGFPVGWSPKLVSSRDWDVFLSGGYYYPPIVGANLQLGHQDRPWMTWSDTPQLDKRTPMWKQALKNAILAPTFKHATLILSTGLSGTQAVKLLGAPEGKIRSLPYYIDQTAIRTSTQSERKVIAQLRSELVDQSTPLILFVGQLIHRKGVDTLVQAAKLLAETNQSFHLVMVGEGPLRPKVEETIQTMPSPGRITALGFRSPDEVRRLMAASDIFVLPSRFDAYPLAALEAQASGLPIVISSSCGVVAERVCNGREGFVISPDDPGALATALEHLCKNGELRRQMRLAALAKSEEHGIQVGVSRFVECVYEALNYARREKA